MAKKKNTLREAAEVRFKKELAALKKSDKASKPEGWVLSPLAVLEYITGKDGVARPKYIGNPKRIEMAIATLASGRALLLMGVPGTAKTLLAEHLTAAISGNSRYIVQGSSGMYEESLTYSWNYAELLANGPSKTALVPSPIVSAMEKGVIARVEELTRIPSDVQDALLMILSEKSLPIPELNSSVDAIQGFNIIATANEHDRGVNELSSALQRRFNIVHMPLPNEIEEEVRIVEESLEQLPSFQPKEQADVREKIKKLVQIFRELREGISEDGKVKFASPSSHLSSAEAISVMESAIALAKSFSGGTPTTRDIGWAMKGTIIRKSEKDKKAWKEYLESRMKKRKDWKEWYEACNQAFFEEND